MKINIKKLLCSILFSALLLNIGSAYALAYKLTLETKKLPSGITHCVWNIHLIHEIYLGESSLDTLEKETPQKIAVESKEHILNFAKKVNAYVLIESMDSYNKTDNKLASANKFIYEKYQLFGKKLLNLLGIDDTLSGTYKILKQNGVNVENIEYRQDLVDSPTSPAILAILSCIIIWGAIKNYIFNYDLKIENVLLKPIMKLTLFSYQKIIILLQFLFFVSEVLFRIEHSRKKSYIHKSTKTKKLKELLENFKKEDKAREETILQTTYLNDIETIKRIIKKEEDLQKTPGHQHDNGHNNFKHTLVVTGGFHSKRIRNAIINDFGYKKTYVSKIPTKIKVKLSITDIKKVNKIKSFCDQGILLHLPTCFKNGLKALKKTT